MKIFLILISWYFVNVLAVDMGEYNKNVFVTNMYIEQAKKAGVLSEVIKEVVCENGHTMEELAVLLVVPERADSNHLDVHKTLQDDLNKKIHAAFVNHIVTLAKKPVINPIVSKGPSAKVLKTAVLPDLREQEGENFEKADLLQYGTIRRTLTQDVIKSIVIDTSSKTETQLPFNNYCFLMGLISCTGDLDSFIKYAEISNDEKCVLTTFNNSKIIYDSVGHIVENIKKLRQERASASFLVEE